MLVLLSATAHHKFVCVMSTDIAPLLALKAQAVVGEIRVTVVISVVSLSLLLHDLEMLSGLPSHMKASSC